MNAGLLRNVANLRDLLLKRNSQTTPFQLQDTTPNSIVGGNTRGIGAVDFQMSRTAATQVASGDYSVVFGQACRASGLHSFSAGIGSVASGTASISLGNGNNSTQLSTVTLGQANNATGSQSVAIGSANTASGANSVALGNQNTAAGNNSFAVGLQNSVSVNYSVAMGQSNTANNQSTAIGVNNTASGENSFVHGDRGNSNSIILQYVHSFNNDQVGQSQKTRTGIYQNTTNATTARLTARAQATPSATNQLTLRNNSVFSVTGKVVARDTATNDARSWEFEVLIKRGANAGTTTIVGTPTVTSLFNDTAAAAWVISVTADTTLGALAVSVTGETGKTIRWVCVHESTEVA